MNKKSLSIPGVAIGFGLILVMIAWGIGSYYQRGVFIGPYEIGAGRMPIYLELPVVASIDTDKDNMPWKLPFLEIGDYHQVAVYNIDLISFDEVRPYPLSKQFPDPLSMKINFSNFLSIDEAKKIIDAQPKHPQYWQNEAQLFIYRLASWFAMATQYYPKAMAILFILALFWLWLCRSPIPFMVWWGAVCTYSLVYRGLYDSFLYSSCKSLNWFFQILFHSPGGMYAWPQDSINLPCIVCAAGFMVIGPILFIVMGYLYLTKHLIPKQKRLYEDFMKYDKDRENKQDLNINEVGFKVVKYDIKKKIKEYLSKSELFLGLDDDGNDVSIPEDLANHHFHCMGPTGSGKTATMILPLAVQALEKGYGACFIDLKGDTGLIKSVKQKCAELGKKFFYFSIDPKERTEDYNPLGSGVLSSKVDRIMSALNLEHEGSAAYYSGEQRTAFTEVLKDLMMNKKYISFPNVLKYLRDAGYLSRLGIDERDVKGLISAIGNISDFPMLNQDGIDLKKIMDDGDVVYFNLKTQINTEVAEAIGRMIIVDFKFWSAYRNEHNPKFFIFIDEFQDIASDFFVNIISKVRNANYCLVLANQSRSNLLKVSQAFHDAVMINSYTKIVFNQFEDAKFWAGVTGSIRVDEPMMRMEAGEIFNEDKTILDGKRVRDGVVSKITKPLYTENTFLRLPKSKSVIFVKGRTATLVNHEFYHTAEEYQAMIKDAFQYEGGKFYGDPYEYLIKQKQQAADQSNLGGKGEKNQGNEKEKKDETNKQDKKGDDKNEKGKSNFRFDGGDDSPDGALV